MNLRDLIELEPRLTQEEAAGVLSKAKGRRVALRTLSLWLAKESAGKEAPAWAIEALRAYRWGLLDALSIKYAAALRDPSESALTPVN